MFVYESTFIAQSFGAILLSDNVKLLHSACFFSNCYRSDEHGGSVFYQGLQSVIQHRFCSTGCKVDKNRVGSHSYTRTNYYSKNYVLDSSISNCGTGIERGTLTFYNGYSWIYSSNVSKNYAAQASGAYIKNSISGEVTKFSTFEGNIASEYSCLYFTDGSARNRNILSNIIKNSRLGKLRAIIVSILCKKIFENCTILGPYGKYPKTFDGDFDIINCNIDNDFSFTSTTPLMKNLVRTKSLYSLNHLSTYKCQAIILNIKTKIKKMPTEESNPYDPNCIYFLMNPLFYGYV